MTNEQNSPATEVSRRRFLKGTTAAGLAAASAIGFGVSAGNAAEPASELSNLPELAPQWKKLDFAEILSRRAAFVSISQNQSLYETWCAQGSEKHRERTSLPATIKVVQAGRGATNFRSFSGSATKCFESITPNPLLIKSNTKPGLKG